MSDHKPSKNPSFKEIKVIAKDQFSPKAPKPDDLSSKTGKATTPADKKAKPVINEIDEKIAGLIGLKNLNEIKNKHKLPQTFINSCCKVIVSADFMEADLFIEPPTSDETWPSLAEAIITIEAEGLAEFDLKAVENAIEQHLITRVSIAKGTAPIHGRDADFHILYELIDLHKLYIEGLTEDEHHRVDYRRVKTVNSVEKGDLVAEKIMATAGTDGVDVRGQIIPAVPGQDKEIKLGKNVIWDDTGLKVYATSPGKPILINNCLNVLPIHEIKGNVNFSTGNIDFAGNLVIHGDVENGFKVHADGDIIIMGNVDSADITTGGKLSVKGGVFGIDKAKIKCSADFYAKKIERANLICEGSVLIREAIMHCQVIAENKVIVEGGKGWIVGGTIEAGESIEAGIIGSRLGTITEIEVSPTYRHLVEALTDQPIADTVSKIGALPKNSRTSRTATGSETQAQVEYTTRGRIKYKERLYPGVRIKIGPHLFVIHDELSPGTLYCTLDGELRLIPSR